jgi:hypothetical protein
MAGWGRVSLARHGSADAASSPPYFLSGSRHRRWLALERRPRLALPGYRILQRVAHPLAGSLAREIDNPVLLQVAKRVARDQKA